MPTDQNPHGRRPHFQRGRRGPDRRGTERRAAQGTADHGPREQREQIDVEQIMRDIRARIAQRHGIELTTQQVHELAARRLEAILDPRNINPSLLEQLRQAAGDPPDLPDAPADPGFTFEDTTLYDSHRSLLRLMRRLLNPILKLFLNPAPLVHALNTQARLNAETAVRERERDRRQMEWNALHYELLQRGVTEVSRVSLEVQHLRLEVESLRAKVDFNERRVRGLEGTAPAPRAARAPEPQALVPAQGGTADAGSEPVTESAEGGKRRRRRRRGRRSGPGASDPAVGTDAMTAAELDDAQGDDDEAPSEADAGESVEPAAAPAPLAREQEPATGSAATDAASPRTEAAGEPGPLPQPAPPLDEPRPGSPVDRPDPGPVDR